MKYIQTCCYYLAAISTILHVTLYRFRWHIWKYMIQFPLLDNFYFLLFNVIKFCHLTDWPYTMTCSFCAYDHIHFVIKYALYPMFVTTIVTKYCITPTTRIELICIFFLNCHLLQDADRYRSQHLQEDDNFDRQPHPEKMYLVKIGRHFQATPHLLFLGLHWTSIGLLLGRRRRRWANTYPTSVQVSLRLWSDFNLTCYSHIILLLQLLLCYSNVIKWKISDNVLNLTSCMLNRAFIKCRFIFFMHCWCANDHIYMTISKCDNGVHVFVFIVAKIKWIICVIWENIINDYYCLKLINIPSNYNQFDF